MIYLFNTITKKKEEFKPLKEKEVLMYYCGPTTYWTQHIGNLRGSTCADVVRRTFEYNDYKVKMIRNYTDVGHLTSDADAGESKIEKRAKIEKLSPEEITEKYIKIYEKDTRDLNILEPWGKPKATENIPEIIEMVKILLEKNIAYATDLAIYFDVSKFKNYNRLSGQKEEEKRTIKADDPDKKHPSDFSLWFFKAGKHKNALQYWPSPFKSPLVENGEGFPGWHIECSAMAKKYLANTIDIHMGGIEHIPVHHTNEIAQSESANETKFANYWLHNEHLTVDGKKMSKSEGTSFSLSDVIKKDFEPLALKYFFLQAHYRSKQNFTWEAIEAAQKGLENLKRQISEIETEAGEISEEFKKEFIEKINDDINTPQALAVLQSVLKSDLSNEDKFATILDFDKVLGLELKPQKIEVPSEIQTLASEREQARKGKDWQKADELRGEIEKAGWAVKDTEKGPQIKPTRSS